MASSVLGIVEPLQSLPSILALSDLRRRLRPDICCSGGHRSLVQLLAADPLATLRALRFVNAPLRDGEPVATIPRIVATLGATAVHRLLDVPPIAPERTTRIRALWLHSLATALAAGRMARAEGSDVERAYVSGLLRDLDGWLHHLGCHHNGEPWPIRADDLRDMWKLPPLPGDAPDLAAITARAAELAARAGFAHPDAAERPEPGGADADDVRAEVTRALHALGLDPVEAGTPQQVPPDAVQELHGTRRQGRTSELVTNLLQCARSPHYGGLISAGAAAALRYLDFDRAFYVGLRRDRRELFVRLKADLSIGRMSRRAVSPTDQEWQAFLGALADGQPRMLAGDGSTRGMCGAIAADRALVVPVIQHWATPTFMVLDRAFSGRFIDLEQDGAAAMLLTELLSVLIDNLELRLHRGRARREATIDPLTRLANRGVGMFSLEQEIARALRQNTPLCVLMLDLDEFKRLNDTYGHLVGDRALRVTSEVLRRSVRRSDTVCRYGGEEFLVVLPETTAEEAAILATRIHVAVAEAGKAEQLPLTASLGLACLRPGEDTVDELIGRADHALYASKARGRNRFSADVE